MAPQLEMGVVQNGAAEGMELQYSEAWGVFGFHGSRATFPKQLWGRWVHGGTELGGSAAAGLLSKDVGPPSAPQGHTAAAA